MKKVPTGNTRRAETSSFPQGCLSYPNIPITKPSEINSTNEIGETRIRFPDLDAGSAHDSVSESLEFSRFRRTNRWPTAAAPSSTPKFRLASLSRRLGKGRARLSVVRAERLRVFEDSQQRTILQSNQPCSCITRFLPLNSPRRLRHAASLSSIPWVCLFR